MYIIYMAAGLHCMRETVCMFLCSCTVSLQHVFSRALWVLLAGCVCGVSCVRYQQRNHSCKFSTKSLH